MKITKSKNANVRGITRLIKNMSAKLVKYAWVKLKDGNVGQIMSVDTTIGKVRVGKTLYTVDLTTVMPMKMYFFNHKGENLGEMCYNCADWVLPNQQLRGLVKTVKARAKEGDSVYVTSVKVLDTLENSRPNYSWIINDINLDTYRLVRENSSLIVKRTDFRLKDTDEYNIINPVCPVCGKE